MPKFIKERKLRVQTRIEGPKHDPWGIEEFIFIENGEKTILRMGMDVQLHHGGQVRRWDHEGEAIEAFCEATGITPNQFWKAHNRAHPFNPREALDDLIYGGP